MQRIVILALLLFSILIVFQICIEVYACKYTMVVHHNKLRLLAHQFKSICTKHNIVYWINGGALLGSIRTGDLIVHDDDIDVAVHQDDMHALQACLTIFDVKINVRAAFNQE